MFKLYLDAGHGGKDSGATGWGVLEKDCTLKIALAIQSYMLNNYDAVEIKMTRTTDVFLSLKERTDAANAWGADFFLSIHCNASANQNASGFATYSYITADAKTKAAQNVIHKEVMKLVPEFKDFGQNQGDFHVVRQSIALALLTENGFVSNSKDANLLGSDQFIKRLAEGHSKGVASFFGLKPKAGVTVSDFKGHWAEAEIKRAMEVGIVDQAENFRPNEPITRAEMVSVALKFRQSEGVNDYDKV